MYRLEMVILLQHQPDMAGKFNYLVFMLPSDHFYALLKKIKERFPLK
jgi:hypothetical protein